ncbi:electron transport complex subunit RsxD [Alkalimonas collagenimarina]|uniref:Ion-translocating oxidoreductase complex subunit D n=1 Tax=Alkalimonas collagenimarina TaxID=400390 RepID=A0ABT9H341_9GAMM|nr:electron transport complex subunit RsxD [Alkalimonas collagenimarina]MDP4537740.1 electron transport complex subunit RsxD [Alkalimonas collagenimarina]
MSFRIASSPHQHSQKTTSQLMLWVAGAALPAIAVQSYLFGYGVLIQLMLAISTAWACEALILAMRQKTILPRLRDHSALVTGLLLAVSIPPYAPWWLIIIGTAFAIIMVKQLYGGLGFNIFNPAMAAYVLLLIAFPVQMTQWLPPTTLQTYDLSLLDAVCAVFTQYSCQGYSIQQLQMGIDGMTMATPLDTARTDLTMGLTLPESFEKPIFSQGAGSGWLWLNVAWLLGGLVLIQQRVIQWRIPLSVLGSLALCSLIAWSINPDIHLSPIFQLFSGASMLAAFFIATDPVSASTTLKGRIYYGILIGVLVFCIRTYGGYPDAFAFAVLLANMAVPLIDYYTRPRTYGHKVKKGLL